jgi:hypothetical protein
MPKLAELLDRESQAVDLESGDFERLLHRRERKQRNRRLRAGAVALVVTLSTAAILLRSFSSAPSPADRPVQPSPTERVNDERVDRWVHPTPVDVTFPMLSAGARPSTPVTGQLVLEFMSWRDSFPVRVDIYADGRVIWHPDQDDVGYLQFRLTPGGVDEIRSMVISTGLVDHDSALKTAGGPYETRVLIRRRDRDVEVRWWRIQPDMVPTLEMVQTPEPTGAQAHDIHELRRFFDDPTAWQLPSDMYADPEVRTFVPFAFNFDFDRSEPDLSQLPSPAREVLAGYFPWDECTFITTDEARELVDALARAGYAPHSNTPVYLDFTIPGPSGPSNPHLTPAAPHQVGCLVNG